MNTWWLRLWRWFVLCRWQRNFLLDGLVLLVTMNTPLFNIVFGFLLAGSVAGTDWVVPWSITLLIYLGCAGYVIYTAYQKGLYPGSPHIQRVKYELLREELRKRRRREAYARRMAAKRQAAGSPVMAPSANRVARRSRPRVAVLAIRTVWSHRLRTALQRFAVGG